MKPKTVVILILCLLLAGVALLLTRESGEPNATNDDAISGSTVRILPPAVFEPTLNSIDILPHPHDRNAGTAISLMKIRGQWEVVMPGLFPANTKAIDRLLAVLSGLQGQLTTKHYDKVPPVKPEELIGVEGVIPHDPPRLELYHTDQSHWKIVLGPRLGAGRAVLFVAKNDEDETTFVAGDVLHDFVDALDQDAFYADRFDPPLMTQIARIEIKTPAGQSALVQENGRWWIEHEQGLECALETSLPGYPGVNDYFALLESIRLLDKQTNYPANGMASFGLERPLISARFVPLGRDPNDPTNGYEVLVGTPADPSDQTRYISNGNAGQGMHPVFTIESKSALALAQSATAFRDPRIVATPSTLIASIELKFADASSQAIELPVNSIPILRDRNDDRRELSIERVASALKQLSDARAMDYVPTRLAEWDELVSFLITPRLGGAPEVFTVYPDPETNETKPTVLVHRGKEPVALRVPWLSVAGLIDPASLISPPR